MADQKNQTGGTELARTDAMGAGGVSRQITTAVQQVRDRVMALPAKRRNLLLGGALFLAAGLAGLAWFWQRPDWRVLFSGLDGKDVQTVSSELAAASIPFQATSDGTGIQVPADILDKARMEVAAKGMPQTGRLGFELFDKPNWVGSEFDERVNYQRALEGELEHTIGTLGVVRSARVHLVLPQQSLFAGQEKIAKASVVLKLRRAALSSEQTEAIRSLVAGAVENLNTENVTLVDAEGRQNLQAKGQGSAAEADMEQALEAKLVAMLEPLAGRENVRATVNVSYDDASVERTDEVYDPSQSATLTMRKTEQTSGGKTVATGVPGTASNTPAAAPAGSAQAAGAAAAAGTPPLLKDAVPVYPTAGGINQSSKEEQGTYGVTHHIVHSEDRPGRIRRVTVAVVVNDREGMEGTGKSQHTMWKPRSADEMKRLEQLAQAAVGFDEKRGDQVVMSNVSFNSNVPEAALSPMAKVLDESKSFLSQQPGLMRTGMMGLIAFCVVLFVLRPVANQMSAALKAPVLLPAGSPIGTTGAGAEALTAGAGGAGLPAPEQNAAASVGLPVLPGRSYATKRTQAIFDHVTKQVAQEPVQSTRLLEVWLGAQEGGE
jgi:flagellar M-ring protein FliF